jgi:2-polyprenyl-6-methoxyphenol hydroxylase-like FAD-dependent oxidoreductase
MRRLLAEHSFHSNMGARYQVIIVGGGPVGVALAVELGRRGIKCALLERRRTLHRIPKGQNLTQRTLEHFYFWGIVEELRAARIMPPGIPISGVTAYKNLMSEFWVAPPGRELVQDYFFQANDRLPQYHLEAVLRRKLATLPGVESFWGFAAQSVAQDADGARVAIVEENGSGRDVIEADYVVGCDGSGSLIREQVGIARGGTDFDQLMVLAVFRSRELHEGLQRFPVRSTYRVLHPDLKGYWQFFGRIDVGEGWFFHAPVPRDTTTGNFDFHGLLERVAGFKFACAFDYVGFWSLRNAVADRYRVGRVFIAGDAAHTHPPYGGFGLNNGLEDAVNLGWKLAARLQGWGGDALLTSYDAERRPIFREVAEDFIAARIDHDAKLLARYSPEHDRAEFGRVWQTIDSGGSGRVVDYEPHYEGSPVVAGPPGGKSGAHGRHMFTARAGHHLAPLPLSSGRNVFEELGPGFTLLALGGSDGAAGAFRDAAQALGVPLKTVRDTFAGGREAYERRLILVRPDQHVAWTADEAPADAGAVIGRAVGRLGA